MNGILIQRGSAVRPSNSDIRLLNWVGDGMRVLGQPGLILVVGDGKQCASSYPRMREREDIPRSARAYRSAEPTKPGIGLALSGGGFRATLFHLGSLLRLNEIGLLSKVDRISSVSGGAILNGVLASHWNDLTFVDGKAVNLKEEVFDPIWDFCSLNVDVKAAILGLALGANPLEWRYRRALFGGKTLQDLPDHPEFIFNAAHIETGRNWTFSKSRMGTYLVGYVDSPSTRISKVVAASSACPPFFAPVTLKLDPTDFRRSKLTTSRGYFKSMI